MIRFARLPLGSALLICTLALTAPLAAEESPRVAVPVSQSAPHRPAALVPLYVSFAALQVVDVHSTGRALAQGSVESNPLMKGFAGSSVALASVKAAGTAAAILASERICKRNRKAAVLLMIATNTAMGWVVQHNYRAVR